MYAGYSRLDLSGVDVGFGRAGLEGQYFTKSLTLDLAGGVKFGDIEQGYGRARLQYYPVDNLMLRGGWLYEGSNFGTLGFEYQFSSTRDTGLALFADANLSTSDTYSVVAGLKVTFGQDMSLKDRHRRQDPDSYTGMDLQSAGNAASKLGGDSCPFVPVSTVCPSTTSLGTKYLPKIGMSLPSPITRTASCTGNRRNQCQCAGFTNASNPGPASCGCAATFACGGPT